MILQLRYDKTISELKREFSDLFPYLKIEFFAETEPARQPPVLQALPGQTVLGHCRGVMKEGLIDLCYDLTVAETEQRFRNHIPATVRIYARSGNGQWTHTNETKNFTLRKQSELARAAAPITRKPSTALETLL